MKNSLLFGGLCLLGKLASAAEYTVEKDGFCLGVTQMYGDELPYIRSDYHFAVMASEFLNNFMVEDYIELTGAREKRINTDVHWNLDFQTYNDFFPGSKTLG